MKVYVCIDNGEAINQVFTSLRDGCNALGVSYQMAVRGKRIFKSKVIVEAEVIKCVAKRRNGFKCLEVARMARYKEDNSFDEDI